METPRGAITLERAVHLLAKSPQVRADLEEHFGQAQAADMIAMMAKGFVAGDLGAEVYDFLFEKLYNDSRAVWSGVIETEHDEYAVDVLEYGGLYLVSAVDYERQGLFLSLDEARDWVFLNWDDVTER